MPVGPLNNTSLLTLEEARKGFEAVGLNNARSQVAGASRIDSVSSTIMSPTGQLLGFHRSFARTEDPMLSAAVRSSYTKTSETEVVKQYLQSLGVAIGKAENPGQSRLVEAVDKFIAKSSTLVGNINNLAMKEGFIIEAQSLAKTLSESVSTVDGLRFKADQNLSENLQEANNVIKKISNLNQGLQKSSQKGIYLHDERDRLLNELSTHMDIRVSFGNNGVALVTSNNGGATIVDQSTYAQFNYTGFASQEAMVTGEEINPVTMYYTGSNGKVSGSIEVIGGSRNKMTPQIYGGKIAGLVELRDQFLPQARDAVSSLAKTVVENVNRIHNNGSPFPPKTKFESAQQVGLLEPTSWSGKIDVAVVNRNGSSIVTYNDGSGAFKPVTIDLENLPGLGNNGQPTIKDIINELNAMLSTGPSAPRLVLGAILDGGGVPIPDQCLLNDIKMVARSGIGAGGNFTFDFELDGSQYFGSKVQILGVARDPAGVNAALPPDQLPAIFSLDKGAHVRTNQSITVGNVVAGVAGQDIRVRFRVIGDNGTVQEGTADFTVPAAGPELNQRIVGAVAAPGGGVNQMQALGITHSSLARAKLVDDNGVELDLNDRAAGHLVIETVNANEGLVINDSNSKDLGSLGSEATDRGFSHYFGFNNFFEIDETHGTMNVREDIVGDVNKMSIGRIRGGNSAISMAVREGETAANATLTFTLGNVPADGDTVTIYGEIYTIRNVPLAANDVAANANMGTVLQNLVDKINNTASISSLVLADLTVPNIITLTAKASGISGNNITVAVNLGAPGGATAALTTGGVGLPAAANIAPAQIQGGADLNVQHTALEPRIGDGAQEILQEFAALKGMVFNIKGNGTVAETSTSLSSYASIISSMLGNQIQSAKSSNQIAEGVLQGLNKELQDKTGISKEDEYVKLNEWAQLYSAGTAYNRMMQKVMDDFFRLF